MPIETLELTNHCTCEDEQGNAVDCGGDCFSADAEQLAELATAWADRHPSEYGYLITGKGMGWTKAEGSLDWNGRDPLHQAIGVSGGWTQRYEFDAHEIRVTQSHHDAMGERYTIRIKTSEEE